MAPTIADKIIEKIKINLFMQNIKIIKGAIFCHVIKIIFLIQSIPSITFGNQKWKGATPLFIINDEQKIIFKK